MELGEPSRQVSVPQDASIVVRTQYNAVPLADVEVELRPGGVKRTNARGECKYDKLSPGQYELCLKGATIWRGRVRDADELRFMVVAAASYARCCHIESAPPSSEEV